MTEQLNVPKLRFNEFEGDWTKSKLGDIGKVKMCKRIFSSQTTDAGDIPFFKIGTFGKEPDAFISSDLYKEFKAKYSFPNVGDILMSASGTLGRTVVYDGTPSYFQDSNIVWLDNDESYTTNLFLGFIYQIVKYQSEGGTIQRLYNSIISSTVYYNPQLPEQQKIASFLSKVDEKIGLLSEKKDKLTEYKRGVMQQLFNGKWQEQDGQLTFVPPTLRFKADDGSEFPDWEEKKFSEISNIKRGASPRPISDPKWFDGKSNVGWVRISDVTRSGRELLKTEQYLTPEGISKSRLIPVGSMIMSICATIGKPIYTTFPVCIHDGFIVFSDLDAHKEYVYYYLSKIEKAWYRYGQPGSQVNLNSDIVGNEQIAFPCLEEQIRIANFLSTIDQKVDLANAELNKAKEWKKGLLQQMFV
ncbi:restriction endonuclease subunit S [Vibrio cyclitrophicus]|uniref:Type I restriction modification DNA specificity domain-containing protein n=2 Tax=Vibrio cyclitrophicus TaxID=47951 RepID=A0A7Z1MM23_9VIBR|nr:restriction endonuclease subunit S [Vibrio cyclitrophicus]PMP20431.1 hypothetical protein BCS91_21760 [Vibrio cyclitrophicus]PMP32093.1 hypothetical protein BCS90_10065 [Vibrio cyclitrophicus]